MKSVKIFLNTKNTRYATIEVHETLAGMRKAIMAFRPDSKNIRRVVGQCCPHERINTRTGRTHREIANVFLCSNNCGAGVAGHELLHAVLWAFQYKKYKNQYPIVINNMDEEEELLHNHSHAVMQFYQWYFKNYQEIKGRYVENPKESPPGL